eukprot:TRINITY_DN15379_c0_g1_i1.p1 TRINITY_DN15379_c0_g1~~TRINITY_DN15379_c0_g1_i1.p1  ORF type:complete len:991 (+),score=287.41 TRINITY_DN15379_c0_g1_i1:45-2975(+)
MPPMFFGQPLGRLQSEAGYAATSAGRDRLYQDHCAEFWELLDSDHSVDMSEPDQQFASLVTAVQSSFWEWKGEVSGLRVEDDLKPLTGLGRVRDIMGSTPFVFAVFVASRPAGRLLPSNERRSYWVVVALLVTAQRMGCLRSLLEQRYRGGDWDGETALHLAVLFNSTSLVRLLLRACHVCDGSPGEGLALESKTRLWMMQQRGYGRKISPIGWSALDRDKWGLHKVESSRCCGGDEVQWTTYAGEYPLSFAVMRGAKHVWLLLVAGTDSQWSEADDAHGDEASDFPAALQNFADSDWCGAIPSLRPAEVLRQFRRLDSYGNSCVHVAVLHEQRDMLELVLEEVSRQAARAGEPPKQAVVRALSEPGTRGLTPLHMAAVMDSPAMFELCLDKLETTLYHFGKYICESLPLGQVDTMPELDEAVPKSHSALALVVANSCGDNSVNEHVTKLLQAKWSGWAGHLHTYHACTKTVGLGILFLFVMEYKSQYSPGGLDGNWNSSAISDLETHQDRSLVYGVLLLTEAVLKLFMFTIDVTALFRARSRARGIEEASKRKWMAALQPHEHEPQAWSKGWDNMFGGRAEHDMLFANKYEPFGVLAAVLLPCHFIAYVENDRRPNWAATIPLAVASLGYYVSYCQYACANRRIHAMASVVMNAAGKTLGSFIFVLAVWTLCFTTSIFLLEDGPSSHDTVFKTEVALWDWTWRALLAGDVGESADDWTKTSGPYWVRVLLYLLYFMLTALTIVVMLNLLVSIFTEAFDNYKSDAAKQFALARGRWILRAERRARLLFGGRWGAQLAGVLGVGVRMNPSDRAGMLQSYSGGDRAGWRLPPGGGFKWAQPEMKAAEAALSVTQRKRWVVWEAVHSFVHCSTDGAAPKRRGITNVGSRRVWTSAGFLRRHSRTATVVSKSLPPGVETPPTSMVCPLAPASMQSPSTVNFGQLSPERPIDGFMSPLQGSSRPLLSAEQRYAQRQHMPIL